MAFFTCTDISLGFISKSPVKSFELAHDSISTSSVIKKKQLSNVPHLNETAFQLVVQLTLSLWKWETVSEIPKQ